MKRLNMNAVLRTIMVIALIYVGIYVGYLYMNGKLTIPKMEQLEQEMSVPQAQETEIPKMEQTQEAIDKVLSTDELLPKLSEEADDFVKQNPVAKMLKEQNFLVSGYHVGINTVLQSHKIPYHDLRSSPAISKSVVSPWNNSYIEAPAGSSTRRLFEIGSA